MNDELEELVRFPREDLDIELKQWMDPADRSVQGKFAKELLALRNHGGGYLIIGFKDEHPAVPDPNRPPDLAGFSTDYFNNIVKKYAEPAFHCMSHVVTHPVTGEDFPVVVVPGGAKVPVRCKADSPDGGKSAKVDTYYIRRLGPESSPPQTGAEWEAMLQKCLLSQREELLTTISNLLGAGGGVVSGGLNVAKSPFAELLAFRDNAVHRLEELQMTTLPPGDCARFEHGRYVLSARIVGDIKELTPTDLLDLVSKLRRYTGWSPLHVFSRPELAPYLVDDNTIECWLARDEARDTAHADFWRLSSNGLITLVRGHQEDSPEITESLGGLAAGTGIELTLPAWRVAEFLLRVREIGAHMAQGPFKIQLIVEWSGLNGRKLFSQGNRRLMLEDHIAREPNFRKELELDTDEIDATLPRVIAKIVNPLLRRFSFFEPPKNFYDEELAKLTKREFA